MTAHLQVKTRTKGKTELPEMNSRHHGREAQTSFYLQKHKSVNPDNPKGLDDPGTAS